ncbi:MAG: hypothetical protein QMD85_01810 [Candidatus Aenigmarchaeota archaeon]|nr:hypothetical protein [Candidatus Aenigmarchaeota archaeon]MDI6722289.1 hypothetical protein [Candidatus Aenigmarchaeota archaeon]
MDFTKRVNLYFEKDERGNPIHTQVFPNDLIAVYVSNGCPRDAHIRSMDAIEREHDPHSYTRPHVRAFCYDPLTETFPDPHQTQKGIIGINFQPAIADLVIGMLREQGYSVEKKFE